MTNATTTMNEIKTKLRCKCRNENVDVVNYGSVAECRSERIIKHWTTFCQSCGNNKSDAFYGPPCAVAYLGFQ